MNGEQSVDRLLKQLSLLAPYACKAGIQGGIARCRKLVPCPDHGDDAEKAPQPDTVLAKVNLNPRWDHRFAEAGIPVLQRDWERAQELAQDREERAAHLRRNPFTVRKERGGNPEVPEDRDTGCPVFGPDGLREGVQGESITRATWQLRDSGFRLVHAHRLMRSWKPPSRLVMVWERTPGNDVRFPWKLFHELTATCFMQVDVWANDRDPKTGKVVHTVNCAQRKDDGATPAYALGFAGGDWAVVDPR